MDILDSNEEDEHVIYFDIDLGSVSTSEPNLDIPSTSIKECFLNIISLYLAPRIKMASFTTIYKYRIPIPIYKQNKKG